MTLLLIIISPSLFVLKKNIINSEGNYCREKMNNFIKSNNLLIFFVCANNLKTTTKMERRKYKVGSAAEFRTCSTIQIFQLLNTGISAMAVSMLGR